MPEATVLDSVLVASTRRAATVTALWQHSCGGAHWARCIIHVKLRLSIAITIKVARPVRYPLCRNGAQSRWRWGRACSWPHLTAVLRPFVLAAKRAARAAHCYRRLSCGTVGCDGAGAGRRAWATAATAGVPRVAPPLALRAPPSMHAFRAATWDWHLRQSRLLSAKHTASVSCAWDARHSVRHTMMQQCARVSKPSRGTTRTLAHPSLATGSSSSPSSPIEGLTHGAHMAVSADTPARQKRQQRGLRYDYFLITNPRNSLPLSRLATVLAACWRLSSLSETAGP